MAFSSSHSMDELRHADTHNMRNIGATRTLASGRTTSSQLTFGETENQSAAADPDLTRHRPIRYDQTDEMALPQRRLRHRPLRNAVRHYTGLLSCGVRTQLLRADECLYRERTIEAIRYLEVGLLGCRRLPELQGLVWMLLGAAHMGVGNSREASVCFLRNLEFCRELGDFAGITKAECNLGIAYTSLGHFRLAERCFLQYLENSCKIQEQISISGALSNLGVLAKAQGLHAYREMRNKVGSQSKSQAREQLNGHLHKAVAYFEQHLEIVEELANLDKQARAYGNLGWCYQVMKQYPQALFCHKKCLEIARTTGDRKTECCTLCNLGNCLRATGKLKEALDNYTLNLELSRASGYRHSEEVSLLNLGTTCELLNKLDKAIEWHTLYLSSVMERGDLYGQAGALRTLAGIYKETQQMTKAEDYYRKLAAVYGQLGKREEQKKANQLVQQMKVDVKQEKMLSAKQSQKTFRRYKSSPRRRQTRTVSQFSIYQLPTLRQRSLTTLTADSVQDAWGSSDGLDHPGTEGIQFQERLVATPPLQRHAHRERLVGELPFPAPDGRTPAYKLSNVPASDHRPLPLPPTPSDTASLTSYESIGERQAQRYHCKTNFSESRHHGKELRRVGTDLSQPVSDVEGKDKEWEQWLHIQDTTMHSQVGSLDIDVSTFFTSRDRQSYNSLSADTWPSHHASAPHGLDHSDQGTEELF